MFEIHPVFSPEAEAGSDSVIAAIIQNNAPPPVEKEVSKEPAKPAAPAARTPNGQFAKNEAEPPAPVEEKEADKEEEIDPNVLADDQNKDSVEAPEEEINIDDYIVTINVDGKPVEVALKDLKADYSGRKYIEANIQKTVEARKQVEQQALALFNTNKSTVQKLTQISNILDAYTSPNIDWENLKKTDPQSYILKRDEYYIAKEKQEQVNAEIARINNEQATLQAEANQRYMDDQAKALVSRLPDMATPDKAKVLMEKMVKAGEIYGYTAQELASVVDHRPILVLNDAIKYHELVEKINKAKSPPKQDTIKKIMLQPGARKPLNSQAVRAAEAARQKAMQSGLPDDVAATLIVSKPR